MAFDVFGLWWRIESHFFDWSELCPAIDVSWRFLGASSLASMAFQKLHIQVFFWSIQAQLGIGIIKSTNLCLNCLPVFIQTLKLNYPEFYKPPFEFFLLQSGGRNRSNKCQLACSLRHWASRWDRDRVYLVGSKKFVEFTLSNCCSCSLPLMNFKTQRLFVSNYTPTSTTHSRTHTHMDRHRLDTPEACESATSVSIMSSSALSPVAQLLLPDKLNSTQHRAATEIEIATQTSWPLLLVSWRRRGRRRGELKSRNIAKLLRV